MDAGGKRMSKEEGPGFTVKDRRIFSPEREEEPTKEEPTKEEPTKEEATKEEATKEEATKEETPKEETPKQETTQAKSEEPKGEPETEAKEEPGRDIPFPEPSFSTFVAFFFFQQAIMFLGDIPNPETKQVTKNLPMAKYLIDTLAIIKEKTKGNLTTDEQNQVDAFLTELRMRYVKAVEGS
jgi:hypothetical protein